MSSTVHATAIVVGEDGILIRGPAGAGKSTLARELISEAESRGRHGALVADDRVALAAASGRLIGRTLAGIAGLLEIRGIGVLRVPYEPAAVLRLVVDLADEPPRMADEDGLTATILGIRLPRITVQPALASETVMWRLVHLRDGFVTVS